MKVFDKAEYLKDHLREINGSLGFVPTMGALHAGHLSLVEQSKLQNDQTIVSIFVNPAQFDNKEDLHAYPADLNHDLALLKKHGVDIVYRPTYIDIYPDDFRFKVTESRDSQVLCGVHRPGHFDGVLTVVLKLLNITNPTRAYFGQKDFQQYKLVHDMCKSLFLDVEIIGAPTVRNDKGLALSSRNELLSLEQRDLASRLHEVLTSHLSAHDAKQTLVDAGFDVDYLEEHWGRRFVAAKLGSVRLIDNVEI